MTSFNWDIKSDVFNISGIANKVNADKLFVSLLVEIEKKGIDMHKDFIISEITDLIPRTTAGINNYATYGFSIMSMLSGQKDRDYFVFKNKSLKDEFTSICNNNINRDNYIWRKMYLSEMVSINAKYIIESKTVTSKVGDNENQFIYEFSKL